MKSICVYCGSSIGRDPAFAGAARELGLVYGGASIGIMGLVADTVLQLGGQVVGVIPQALASKEIAHANLTELHITSSMHERKTKMAELSDGFIALPGGIGTLEEIFEIWTWAQLGIHAKPCGLLNAAGYFDALTTFLDHAVAQQFVKAPHRSILMVEQEPDALLDRFASYQAPALPQWVGKAELKT